jgi:hypothetical protein
MSKKRRQRRGPSDSVTTPLETLLDSLWAALSGGDLLEAEQETSRCIALSRLLSPEPGERDDMFIDLAVRSRTPESAALLRLIALLGPPAQKRKASRALGELIAAGIFPPEWAAEAGKATPRRAWRQYDRLGDEETITVSYRYQEVEHAIAVEIDLTALPSISDINVVTEMDNLADDIAETVGPFELLEEISLEETRLRLEPAIARSDRYAGRSFAVQGNLALARARFRRLPVAESAIPVFTADDRAAAVADFMKSPEAADAVATEADATRFWAEVLTGYSARIQGEPPVQVGPNKLSRILREFAPDTFTLTEVQRRQLPSAVTAWARWTAAYRGLDEAATEHLIARLPEDFAAFNRMYDDEEVAAARAYLAGVATSDMDYLKIDEAMLRRVVAVPLPWDRDEEQTGKLDATDPADRHAYAAAEFAGCDLPDGMTRDELVSAAHRVIEEIWSADPPSTWRRVRDLLSQMDRHDAIHALIRQPVADSTP